MGAAVSVDLVAVDYADVRVVQVFLEASLTQRECRAVRSCRWSWSASRLGVGCAADYIITRRRVALPRLLAYNGRSAQSQTHFR